jgi:hypothetical protein
MDMQSPAANVKIQNSYGTYNGDVNTDWWKTQCQGLPCALSMAWPRYATAIIDIELAGKPAVIQAWKGICEEALPSVDGYVFPGGAGAEVGVYSRAKPADTPPFPFAGPEWTAWLSARMSQVTDIWWPAPHLVSQIDYTLTEPTKNVGFFSSTTRSYWDCEWMNCVPDYAEWMTTFSEKNQHGFHFPPTPADAQDFTLDFSVTDPSGAKQNFTWGQHDSAITRH